MTKRPHDEMPRPLQPDASTTIPAGATMSPRLPVSGMSPGPFGGWTKPRRHSGGPVAPQGRVVPVDATNVRRFSKTNESAPGFAHEQEVEVELHRGHAERFLESVETQHGLSQSELGLESLAIPWIDRVVDSYSGARVGTSGLFEGARLESVVEARPEPRFLTCELSPGVDARAVARELGRLPEVARAVAVPIGIPPQVSDPLLGFDSTVRTDAKGFENQWYVHRCGIHEAWRMASGANVVIVDIDTGFLPTHQDLGSQIEAGRLYNSFDGSENVTAPPDCAHGTAVLGIVGAANNGLGLAGIAFDASLWVVQAFAGATARAGNAWSRGLEWARTQDARGRRKVIVLEVESGTGHSYEQVPSVGDAIRRAIAEGIVVCVAAGNGSVDAGVDEDGQPFPETGAIVVGATLYHPEHDCPADFSNWGPRVTVAAPGDPEHDLTCDSSTVDAYRNGFGGTSGATPKVAGVVALMLEVNPELTHAEVRTILSETGSAIATDPARPIGRFLDGAAAVSRARALANGPLELFMRGPDGRLARCCQREPNGADFDREPMPGWADRLASARNGDGSLELVARGADGGLWSSRQSSPRGEWLPWRALGGSVDTPTVQRDAAGALTIFGRAENGELSCCAQAKPGGAWGRWHSLAPKVDAPLAIRRADGRLEVVGIGEDHDVCLVRRSEDRRDAWESCSPGGWVDRVAAIVHVDGRLEVFGRGFDRAVWHASELEPGGEWTPWRSLGGVVDRIVATRNADGRAELFAIGLDHALWHVWQHVAGRDWSGWHSLGGFVRELEVSAQSDGRLVVFATDESSLLCSIEQRVIGAEWSDWRSHGIWADLLAVGRNALG